MTHRIATGLAGLLTSTLVGAAVLLPKEGQHRNMDYAGDGRAWLGVSLRDVTPERGRELKLPGEFGAIVTEVEEESPAAKAGLATGDVILEFAGERVRSVAHLRRLVRETPPGRTVALEVSRAGQTRRLNAQLESGPIPSAGPNFPMPPVPRIEIPRFDIHFASRRTVLGISADDLTSQLAAYFGVKEGKGILVHEVAAGGAAEKAGLKAGDCIVRIDSNPVESVRELRRELDRNSDRKRKITLTIVRDHREQTLSAELEPSKHGFLYREAELDNPGVDSGQGYLPPDIALHREAELENLGIDSDELCDLKDDIPALEPEAQGRALEMLLELE